MGRRIAILIPLAALLAGLTAGCGDETPEPGGDRLGATLVGFEPAAAAVRIGIGAVGDAPIDLAVVSGWLSAERPGTGMPDRDEDKQVPDQPGRSYVLVTATTGCRVSDTAELWRDGDDLRVRFVGGQDREECVAAYNAMAQFEVESAQVEGVTTVSGRPVLAGAGPAKLTGFVQLGPISRPSIEPVELRGNAGTTLYAALQHARASNLAEARDALQRPPTAGHRAYGYVLSGCAETGARLIVQPKFLIAELTGAEKTVCAAAAYFLATFEIPAKLVPAAATPQ